MDDVVVSTALVAVALVVVPESSPEPVALALALIDVPVPSRLGSPVESTMPSSPLHAVAANSAAPITPRPIQVIESRPVGKPIIPAGSG